MFFHSLTVADGSQCVVVLHALTDDPPLGEDGVEAQGIHVKVAPGSHQVVCADVTRVSADGEVPVRQRERGVPQHVLVVRQKRNERKIKKVYTLSGRLTKLQTSNLRSFNCTETFFHHLSCCLEFIHHKIDVIIILQLDAELSQRITSLTGAL